jgi:hypothetical protein
MKNLILILLIAVMPSCLLGQNSVPNSSSFFNSYQDYKDSKPIAGYEINQINDGNVEVVKDGKTEKIKTAKLPSIWFTNINGMLMRVFDGDIYYVLVDGKICHYVKRSEGQVGYSGPGTLIITRYSPDDKLPGDYFSETINGEIKKLKGKDLDKLLEQYGLKDQYDADKVKREAKDSVDGYNSKGITKTSKYIKLINAK